MFQKLFIKPWGLQEREGNKREKKDRGRERERKREREREREKERGREKMGKKDIVSKLFGQ